MSFDGEMSTKLSTWGKGVDITSALSSMATVQSAASTVINCAATPIFRIWVPCVYVVFQLLCCVCAEYFVCGKWYYVHVFWFVHCGFEKLSFISSNGITSTWSCDYICSKKINLKCM